MLYLLRFNFTLKHVLRIKIRKADRLSRRPDWKIGIENDNENQKLIKEEWIRKIIGSNKEKDKEVVKVIKEIKKIEVRNLREDKWEIKGDLY